MGILKKLKDMFIEEEEVEEPIKTEVKQVIIPAPVEKKAKIEEKEEKIDEVTLDIKPEPKEEKSVFFGDDEFEGMTRASAYEKKDYHGDYHSDYRVETKTEYKGKPKDDKKVFRPTPVISPVYGVLDKNYSKEDITTRAPKKYEATNTKDLTIDLVRKKAYGTLEDELETTLSGVKVEEVIPKNDIFEDLEKDTDMFEELEEANLQNLNNLDKFEKELLDEVEPKEEEPKLNNDDLFNLIDSMYEKRDE